MVEERVRVGQELVWEFACGSGALEAAVGVVWFMELQLNLDVRKGGVRGAVN